MTLEKTLRLTLTVQVASAGLALTVAGTETTLSGIAMIAFAVISALVGKNWPVGEKARKSFWNVLAVFALFIFLVEFALTQQLLPSIVRLVVFLTTYKLFNLYTNKDYFTTVLLSLLQILAATSISYDYMFAFPYVIFIISSSLTLILYTMKSGREREQFTRNLITGIPPSQEKTSLPIRKFPPSFSVALLVLLITILIFPVLPRVRTDVMGSGQTDPTQVISGFSQSVSLDAISDIKTSPRVVMRVTVNGDAIDRVQPKLRGITLSRFDGYNWNHSFRRGRAVQRSTDGNYHLGEQVGALNLSQEIILSPLNTRVIFTAGHAETLRGPFGRVFADNKGSLFMSKKNFSRIRYNVQSVYPANTAQSLRGIQATEPTEEMMEFLALPENGVFTAADKDQIHALAQSLTSGANDQFEILSTIQDHLRNDFTYSLQLSQYRGDRNKMLSFLFDRKSGHCSYFASAMVIMARTLGIPARMVNGFQLGQYNPIGGFYTVRAADAHSWVEAYFPGRGWVEFDPTPAGGQESAFAAESPNFFNGFLESIDMMWTQYVLAFDALDQQEVYAGMAAAANAVLDSLNAATDAVLSLFPTLDGVAWLEGILRILIQFAIVAILLLAVFLLIVRPFFRFFSGTSVKKPSMKIDFFEKTQKLLRKNGIVFEPTHTARDLLIATESTSYAPVVHDIVSSYEIARFGSDEKQINKALQKGSHKTAILEKQLKRNS